MTANAAAWTATIEDFNKTGSFGAVAALMDAGFTLHGADGTHLTGRDTVVATFETRRRDRKWSHCDILGVTSHGDWVAVISRNTYADSAMTGATVIRFNQAGAATEMWTHAIEEPTPQHH
jgi:hypothetical protein